MEIEETQNLEAGAVETTNNAPAEEVKAHPAWDRMLAELPEVLHAKVTPYLQEQDRNFQQQIEKYTPYKELIEQGYSADVLTSGANLVNAMAANPVEVFTNLKEYLADQGMLPKEAAAAAAEIMENESGEDIEDIMDGDVPASVKKELKDLRAKTEKFENYQNDQALERETEKELASLQRSMDDLKSKYAISEAHEETIYNLMNAALSAGNDITLEQAAQQLSTMIGGFRPVAAAQAQAAAPVVIGSAGGAGVPAQGFEPPKTDKEKRAALAQMFEEYRKSNQ